MSDFPSYESITERVLGDITEPKIIPSGTWEGEFISGKAQKSNSETKPNRAYFPIKFIRPTDNVSPAMLDDFTDEDLVGAKAGWEWPFWDESSIQRLKKTLLGLGVPGDDDTTLAEFYKMAAGLPVRFDLLHEPNHDDPDNPYIRVKNVRPMNNEA